MRTKKKTGLFIVLLIISVCRAHTIDVSIVKSTEEASPQDLFQLYKDSSTYYIETGDFKRSLLNIQKSHEIALKIFKPLSNELALSYFNLANNYSYNLEYDTALTIIKRAEQIYLESEIADKKHLGLVYSSMGIIYKTMGDYFHASEYFKYANNFLFNEKKEPYTRWEATLYMRQAVIELNLNNYKASISYLEKSYPLIQKMPDNSNSLITYYINSANAYAKMNDLKKSIDLQLKAIAICHQYPVHLNNKLNILYNNIGLDYLEINDFTKAEEYFVSGIEMQKKISQKGEILSELHESLGNLFERQNNYNKALENYHEALQIVNSDFSTSNFYSNPSQNQISNKLLTLKILKSKSRCLSKIYDKEKEFKYLEAALNTSLLQISLVEELRESYQSFEAKLQIAELENYTYKSSLELTNKAFQISGDNKYSKLAFEISEKSRSAILLSSIREIDARVFGKIPENLLVQEKKLLKDIALLKENIYEENQAEMPDMQKLQAWGLNLFEVQNQQEQLIKKYEKDFPDYYSLKYNHSVITPEKIQTQLSGNTSILEFCVLDNMLHTFVITKNEFYYLSASIDSVFFQLVNDYLAQYHNFDYSKQSYSNCIEFCWNSNSLYKTLIQPVKEYIKGDNLIIVPEGILSYVPFETLIKEMPGSMTSGYYKNLSYLLYDYNISYSYSSTLYAELEKKSSNKKIKKLLAFAPEYDSINVILSGNQQLITRQKKYRKELYPIPGVIDEVNAIKNLIHSDVFVGKEATETNFRNIAEMYDILHLAMHTLIDNENPMFSKLIFTLGKDTLNDGLLNTFEIFSLKLKAKMVVLSACNTGEGNFSKGEGVMSLARSFAYAGAPSMILTLWEVEDKSGVKLMKDFYTGITKGMTKPEALRYAKMKYIEEARPENSHPFFWSAYISMGNPEPLFRKIKFISIVLLVSGISIMLILGILYKKRRSQTKIS